MSINLGTSPYYDDFENDKNFHRILFKPGYAVQARELTQLQTILQNQIQRFGDHVFKDGSVVVGCAETFQFSVPYVRIKNVNAAGLNITSSAYDLYKRTLVGATVSNELGVSAKIVRLDEDSLSQRVLYLNYQTSFYDAETDTTLTEFGVDESLKIVDANGVEQTIRFSVSSPAIGQQPPVTGVGSLYTIDDGIVYAEGAFVRHESQTRVLDFFSSIPTKNIGFRIITSTVNSDDDVSLLDPASGSYNYSAPGADRYKLTTQLESYSTETVPDTGFYLLFNVTEGKVKRAFNKPQYSELQRVLAQRTFDESGNYVVSGLNVNIREHLNIDDNNGKFDAGDSSLLLYGIEPGKAYVEGFDSELKATEYLPVEKAFDTLLIDEQQIPTVIGNFVYVKNVVGTWNIGTNITSVSLTDGSDTIATAKVRLIRFYASISGTAFYKLYLYDVVLEDGKGLSDLETVTTITDGTNTATVAITPGDNLGTGVIQTGFKLHSTSYNSLIFPTASKAVVEYENDTDYFFWKNLGTFTFDGTGVALVSVSGLGQTLVYESTPERNFLVVKSSGEYVAVNSITNTTNTSCNLNVDSANSGTHTVLARVRQGDGAPIDLTLNTTFLAVEGEELVGDDNFDNNIIYLGVPHVHDIEYVYVADKVDGFVYPANESALKSDENWRNITENFILYPNTSDNEYRTSYVEYTGTSDLSEKILVVKFRNFTRASTLGYLNRNSYQSALIDFDPTTPDFNKQIYTYELPVYTTQTTGVSYDIRDVIDFRPAVELRTGFSGRTYAVAVTSPMTAGQNDPVTTLNTTNGLTTPDPDSTLTATFTINLPRKDKVILTRDGEFRVVKGISSLNPQTPAEASNSMTLAVIELAPYPSLSTYASRVLEREDYASIVRLVDNRRYTMRDIGDLEQRVNRLEYYTVLSIAENRAANMLIEDALGNAMAKKGILVDAFDGHDIGNVFDTEYNVSIDAKNKTLRAPFTLENVEFYIPEYTGETFTTSYSGVSTPLIENRFASKSRVCGNSLLGNYMSGQLQLTPSQATWFDTAARPDVQVNYNGINDGWEFSDTPFNIHWNGWQNIWLGVEVTNLPVVSINTVAGLSGTRTYNEFAPLVSEIIRGLVTSGRLPANNLRSIGVRVVDVSVVPYIAQQAIMFTASGLKPGTAVKAYFDDEDVTVHCRSFDITVDEAKQLANSLLLSNEETEGYDAPLIVTETGELVGQFLIPKNRFRAGSKIFKLMDADESTSAATQFHALGVPDINEGSIASTRFPEIRQDALSETQNNIVNRLLLSNPSTFNPSSYGDPMAQTFIVEGEPDGVFIEAVDLYFRRKSVNKGVTIQIREVVNGFPGNKIVPFSTKTLKTVNIFASDNASVKTTFTFDSPVYLKNNVEYALVLLPENNSTDFEVWVSELGEALLGTNERITQQPYVGVLFVPNNNTTWTALEKEDLKFSITTRSFQTSRTVILESMPIDYVKLSTTGSYTLKAGDVFRVFTIETNEEDEEIEIETCTGIVRETYEDEVKLHITSGSLTVGDEFEVNGTTFVVDEILNKVVTALAPNFGTLEFAPTTQMSVSYKILEQPNVYFPSIPDAYIPIKNGDTVELPKKFTLFSHSNSTNNIATLKVKAVLSTSRSLLTPVLDTTKMSMLTLGNVISSEPNSPAKYITRAVTLDGDGADDLRVFFDMIRPESTSVFVEVKLQSLEDDRPFSEVEWTEMTENAPAVYNSGVYQEYSYSVKDPEDAPESFAKFAIRITLRSSDESKTPLIKNFRAVAVI
jgi:hypothetical protein